MIRLTESKFIEFKYLNWRGESSYRKAYIESIYYGSTEYHKEDQWLMEAWDTEKDAIRVFAMKDMEEVNFRNNN